MNFTQFNKNGGVEGFCLIKTVDRKMTAKGVPYLDLTLADPDGEINAKLWDYKEELHGEFAANDLIKVRGTVQPFNDSQQLRIERIRKVTEADGVRIEDFVPSAGFSGEAMFNELMKVAGNFKDEELKTLVTALLNEYKDRLLYWPAAFRLHHAIRGGSPFHRTAQQCATPAYRGKPALSSMKANKKRSAFFDRTLKVGIFVPYRTCSPFFQTAVP